MATPFGSGLLALIVQLMRQEGKAEWTAIEAFREFIKKNVDDRGAPGHDPRFGHGVPLYTQIVHNLLNEHMKWV